MPFGSRRAFFAAPGDYNGDQFDDIAIAITDTGGGSYAEEGIYLIFGKTGPWDGELDVVKAADAAIPIKGTFSIANAGDVDGDGKDDLLIGKTAGDPSNRAYLFYGRDDWAPQSLYLADFNDAGGAASLDGVTIDNAPPEGSAQVAGLWHLSSGRGAEPGHSASSSLYFGQGEGPAGGGNYNVGRTAGTFTTPIIDLTTVRSAELSFNSFLQTERHAPNFDHAQVSISASFNGEPFSPFTPLVSNAAQGAAGLPDPSDGWQHVAVDLANFVQNPITHPTGSRVQIRFEFDTKDSAGNEFEGWYVDDVQVRTFLQESAADVVFQGNFNLGDSVSGIGDINGDGLDDAAIVDAGASTGQVHLLLGAARGQGAWAGGFPDQFADVTLLPETGTSFGGFKVKPAGNVDGDFLDSNGNGQRDPAEHGFDDVILAGSDTSYIVFGGPPLTTASAPVSMTTLLGQTPKQAVKMSTGGVFSLGDSTGDGFSDLGAFVISSYPRLDETSQDRHGVGHVFYGGARSGFNPSVPDLVLEPAVSDFALFVNAGLVENFRAYKFAGMGDINGDQRTDFALADGLGGVLHAYLGRNPQPAAPPPPGDASRLPSEPFVFGLATPLLPVVADPQGVSLPRQSPTPIPVDRAFALIGSRSNEGLGQSRSVGDVNGDGFEDLLVSGISANYILLGPVELDAAESVASRANIKVDAASLISPATGHGDLNGDGFDDLVFRSATEQNRLRVVFGGANLPATLAAGGDIDSLRPAGSHLGRHHLGASAQLGRRPQGRYAGARRRSRLRDRGQGSRDRWRAAGAYHEPGDDHPHGHHGFLRRRVRRRRRQRGRTGRRAVRRCARARRGEQKAYLVRGTASCGRRGQPHARSRRRDLRHRQLLRSRVRKGLRQLAD